MTEMWMKQDGLLQGNHFVLHRDPGLQDLNHSCAQGDQPENCAGPVFNSDTWWQTAVKAVKP